MRRETDHDIVIIIPPAGINNTVYPPYGAMYVASALRKNGFTVNILNVDTDRYTNGEVVSRISEMNPGCIGYSGIVAPSYKYIKELSFELRRALPDKKQILGGGLASAAEVVLKNTAIDIVVRGEGDETIVDLMKDMVGGADLGKVAGISYKKDGSCVSTGERKLIGNLDTLPYPAFDLVDMNKYMPDGIEFIKQFTNMSDDKKINDPKRKRNTITIPTSRGCFGRCSFCFRAYPGIRLNSMKYVFDLIEYCIEKFDAGFFTFGDECFAPNKTRNWEFIEEYKRRGLDIIFRILGMRVDTVDRDILHAYKEIGCWMIEYGFESGSQKMLNIIDKRVSVEQNRQVALWTKETGIHTSPALVLAMPGETDYTVNESIDFLKSLNFGYKQYQWSYALPIPGAPLYDFAKMSGAISNEDAYLSSLTGDVAAAGIFHVNLTDMPEEAVLKWEEKVRSEVDGHYLINKYRYKWLAKIMGLAEKVRFYYRNGRLWQFLIIRIKTLVSSIIGKSPAAANVARSARFQKNKNINFEQFLDCMNRTTVNGQMALKKINERIKVLDSVKKG